MEPAKYITVFDHENGDVSTYPLNVWKIEEDGTRH